MKLALMPVAMAAVLGMAITSLPAQALEYQAHSGSECKVFGATAWTDLHFSAAGVTNLSATPKNVICPLVKKTSGNWDSAALTPTNAASLHAHIRSGAVASRTVCTVYAVNGQEGGSVTDSYALDTGTLSASTEYIGSSDGLDTTHIDPAHSTALLLCTLGPKAILRFYNFYEQAGTE
jgi:hypothetical protein